MTALRVWEALIQTVPLQVLGPHLSSIVVCLLPFVPGGASYDRMITAASQAQQHRQHRGSDLIESAALEKGRRMIGQRTLQILKQLLVTQIKDLPSSYLEDLPFLPDIPPLREIIDAVSGDVDPDSWIFRPFSLLF